MDIAAMLAQARQEYAQAQQMYVNAATEMHRAEGRIQVLERMLTEAADAHDEQAQRE